MPFSLSQTIIAPASEDAEEREDLEGLEESRTAFATATQSLMGEQTLSLALEVKTLASVMSTLLQTWETSHPDNTAARNTVIADLRDAATAITSMPLQGRLTDSQRRGLVDAILAKQAELKEIDEPRQR